MLCENNKSKRVDPIQERVAIKPGIHTKVSKSLMSLTKEPTALSYCNATPSFGSKQRQMKWLEWNNEIYSDGAHTIMK